MFLNEPFGGLIPGARGAVLAALLSTGNRLTGRQVHRLVSHRYSLWSAQEALKYWVQAGVVDTEVVGSAVVHSVNEDHYVVAPLRSVLDPLAVLAQIAGEVTGDDAEAVIVFGSVARGDSHPGSDVDLAVIARPGRWDLDRSAGLAEAVRKRTGNWCDVLDFTAAEFARLAADHVPVVDDILTDGLPLTGEMPRRAAGPASPCVHLTHARHYLTRAAEFLAAADASLAAALHTPAAGDAISQGIRARDAIVTALTGTRVKSKDDNAAAQELHQALRSRPDAASAERAMRELAEARDEVERSPRLQSAATAEQLVGDARTLASLAEQLLTDPAPAASTRAR